MLECAQDLVHQSLSGDSLEPINFQMLPKRFTILYPSNSGQQPNSTTRQHCGLRACSPLCCHGPKDLSRDGVFFSVLCRYPHCVKQTEQETAVRVSFIQTHSTQGGIKLEISRQLHSTHTHFLHIAKYDPLCILQCTRAPTRVPLD